MTTKTAESGTTNNLVHVPAVGGDVRIRAIPPKLLRAIHGKATKGGRLDFQELMVWQLVYGLADPNFTEDEAREVTRRWSLRTFQPVIDRIDSLSGTNEHLRHREDPPSVRKLTESVLVATAWLQRFPRSGRAPRPATNQRRTGSRRTTGSGSTSSGEDDPDLQPRRCQACGADISHRVRPGPGRKPEHCNECRLLRRRATRRKAQRKQRRKEQHEAIVDSPERLGRIPRGHYALPGGRLVSTEDEGPPEWDLYVDHPPEVIWRFVDENGLERTIIEERGL